MKKILLIVSLLSIALCAEFSMEEIEKMSSEIESKREKLKSNDFESMENPFVELKTEAVRAPVKPKQVVNFVLHAVMNGKAHINGDWRSVNDIVSGYTVKYIDKDGVVLGKNNIIKKLHIYKKRDNFINLKEGK